VTDISKGLCRVSWRLVTSSSRS